MRVIAATNSDLKKLAAEGRFREDLFYRLKVVLIQLPPLRARKNDIPLLADHFVKRFGKSTGREITGYTAEALAALVEYDWPGNVRELENAIEHAFVTCRGSMIDVYDLPGELRVRALGGAQAAQRPGAGRTKGSEAEKAAILEALSRNAWNRTRTAEDLGMSRTTLWKKMKELGISER